MLLVVLKTDTSEGVATCLTTVSKVQFTADRKKNLLVLGKQKLLGHTFVCMTPTPLMLRLVTTSDIKMAVLMISARSVYKKVWRWYFRVINNVGHNSRLWLQYAYTWTLYSWRRNRAWQTMRKRLNSLPKSAKLNPKWMVNMECSKRDFITLMIRYMTWHPFGGLKKKAPKRYINLAFQEGVYTHLDSASNRIHFSLQSIPLLSDFAVLAGC